jgi:hypothetical protein
MEEDSFDPKNIDIEKLLAEMAPPRVPDEIFDHENADVFAITGWDRAFAASVIAGLLTEPKYYGNNVRLDWLQRLVISKAEGKRRPGRSEFGRVLNRGLKRAKVLQLEDPNEDLFCDRLLTSKGSFRIFNELWENAGPYTQTLLDAFEASPESPSKSAASESIYAALRLSDCLAERASVTPLIETAGKPNGIMNLPPMRSLLSLAARVVFKDDELSAARIDKQALEPFIIPSRFFAYVSDREPGDTPLEFYPLLNTPSGLVVLCPGGISLAIRALIIGACKKDETDKHLLANLLRVQEQHSENSGFWPVNELKLSEPNRKLLRGAIWQFAQGHFLQVIQLPVTLDHFPDSAFGSVVSADKEIGQSIASLVHQFWDMTSKQGDFRTRTTVILTSGWGAPHAIDLPISDPKGPEDWLLCYISFADAAVLGACEDGKFTDIIRLLRQEINVRRQGFNIHNLNGLLNLFGFWRLTRGNLIPEHLRQIQPPCNIAIPTDELLKPRTEAFKKIDARSLQLPTGAFRRVQRIDWHDDELKPIYGSLADVKDGRLLGAVLINSHVWWVETIPAVDADREWSYRLWHAVLHWLNAVGSKIVSKFPLAYPPVTSQIVLSVPPNLALESIAGDAKDVARLGEGVEVVRLERERLLEVKLSTSWRDSLRRRENDAEVELISAIFEGLADSGSGIARSTLSDEILQAIGSRDWRWIHARSVVTPMDYLSRYQLVGKFHRVPQSAISLVKCGSVWNFHKRSDGLEVSGENECKTFLALYRDHILDDLVTHVRRYNREELTVLSADRYHAARVEQQHWRATIRALRAIHGLAADANALKHQNEINAVQRATKSICEIAACEAQEIGGITPGRIELDELFAKALLLFTNGQLFASIRAGVVKPLLQISPAGDLLSDKSILEMTLRPAVEWANTRALDDAASAYGESPVESGASRGRELLSDDALRRALEGEYRDTVEAFVELQYAAVELAEKAGAGVSVLRRSELCGLLNGLPSFPKGDHTSLLERLTLPHRKFWRDLSSGLAESEIDLSRFDRPLSIINRPLVALDETNDPKVLVAPIFIADAMMYSLSGLLDGTLNNNYWASRQARKYAGARGKDAGDAFEQTVAQKLRELKLEAFPRCKLSWALNLKVDASLGDIDVLAISSDRKRVWVIEAKNLRLCRSEAEIASRLFEYQGRTSLNSKGVEEPDKLLRHIRRVEFLREHRHALCGRLNLVKSPTVNGLLVVDSPQPMNFYMISKVKDAESVFLDEIARFRF